MALTLRSQRQIQTDILNALITRLGLTDVNPGSIIDIITQAVAQEDFNQYVQMSQIVRLVDLNSTTGEDLDNRAFEFGVTRVPAQATIGTVVITRANYTRVATTFVSSGVLAPSAGNTFLRVNDASGFRDSAGSTFGDDTTNPPTFSFVVIGRGTDNEERRPIAFTPSDEITDGRGAGGVQQDESNTFWYISLAEELENNHAFNEEIVLIPPSPETGFNDITIPAGTNISAPGTGTSATVDFQTIVDNTLLAGESTLTGVDIRASEVGEDGNVGTGTISNIDIEGLAVNNNTAFTTGTNLESDSALRDRIRSSIQSLSRGTREAVLNAIVGIVDTATSRRVVSASVILPQDTDTPVRVYIDDGTGFEPTFQDQSFETVVGSGSRGTTRIQLDFAPLVKASIESANEEPFDLSAILNVPQVTGLSLISRVGRDEETINFLITDLDFPATVRAEEIVRIINDRSNLIEARTSEDGSRVVITARADINEDIFVFGGTANEFIQFTNNEQSTLYLYRNDRLLSKDGVTAFLDSGINGPYVFSSGGDTFTIIVDGKSANPQSVTLTGPLSTAEVIDAINANIAGAEAIAIENNSTIRILSNTVFSSSSSLQVVDTPANTILGFSTVETSGANRDYTLNRELGTIQLTEALEDGDLITSGNNFNRASIRSTSTVNNTTAIDDTVAFNIIVDEEIAADGTTTGGTTINVTFDDRFSGDYLNGDFDTDSRLNDEFGFVRGSDLNIPALIVEYLNDQLYPYATAFIRDTGLNEFIEIRTNTISSRNVTTTQTGSLRNGTIRFVLTGTQGIWEGVTDNVVIENERPHLAFRESEGQTSFEFAPTDAVIIVIDNDFINNTFNVPMNYTDTVLSVTDSSNFVGTDVDRDFSTDIMQILPSPLAAEIPNSIDLSDYYIIFTGRNGEDEIEVARNILRIPSNGDVILSTAIGDGTCTVGTGGANRAVCESEGGVWTYDARRDPSPITSVVRIGETSQFSFGAGGSGQISLADLNARVAVGDIVQVSALTQEVNNGSFVITEINETNGIPYIAVFDPNGIAENNSSGAAIISAKRQLMSNSTTGLLTTTVAFPVEPEIEDEFIIIPNTIENLVVQLNNNRLSSLSLATEVVASDNGTRLQITSRSSGSTGFVEITGGIANNLLDFDTQSYRGLQGYNYYTGLLSLVHRTIYGDDTDLNTFPGIGAAGIQFQVLAPTVTEIILELDVTTTEGVSLSAVENQINTAVTGYINGLGVGEDVIVEQIRARVIQINGILDVVISRLTGGSGGTSFDDINNIAIADNEIARISVSDITLG